MEPSAFFSALTQPFSSIKWLFSLHNLHKQKDSENIYFQVKIFSFLSVSGHEAGACGSLRFKKKYTSGPPPQKKTSIVLALRAKNVLKLMTLMMITHLYHTYGVFFTIVNVNSTVMVKDC